MRHLPRQAVLSIIGAVLLLAGVIVFAPAPSGPAARATPTAVAATAPAVGTPSPAQTAVPTTTAPAPSARGTTPPVGSNDSAAMLRQHNDLRAGIGAPLVRGDDRVTAAAQRHAEYLVRNATGGHVETTGQPGFTGENVRDRLAAQGYDASAVSEVATSVGPGTEGVRSLWVLPYHRLGLMHPHAVVAGWGYAESAGRRATVGVMLYDFASPAPEVVRSPAAGPREATLLWDGREDVDVAPGAPRPLGYTVMAVWSRARAVTLRGSSLMANGRGVAHEVAPQIYERDYVALVPLAPLVSGTRYRVRLDVTVAGVDAVEEWEFETER